jgi:glycerophosphoryl diester phosphodiesterase
VSAGAGPGCGGKSTQDVGLIGGLKIGAIWATDKENFRYCFATIPKERQKCSMLVVAHRGASAAEPENTPAAFRRADAMGADGVELDVRIAVDGSLVVAHDPLPADDPGLETSAAPRSDAPAYLEEALQACGSTMLVNVEIKNLESEDGFDPLMTVVDRTVELLRSRGDHVDRWLISSFSWATIDHCRRIAPEFATAALCLAIGPRGLERVARSGHSAVNPKATAIDAALVRRAHSLGLAVNAWTVNNVARLRELSALDVDGIVTRVPDEALAELGRSPDRPLNPRWGRRA